MSTNAVRDGRQSLDKADGEAGAMGFDEASSALTESMPSFLRSYVFPSLLSLGIAVLFLAPAWPKTVLLGAILKETTNEFALTMMFLFVALVIAVVSAFIAIPTYNVLAGYIRPKKFAGLLTGHQLKVFHRLQSESGSLDAPESAWAVRRLQHYPRSDPEIGPTKFGNILGSAATYGLDRFGLDSRTFWYELKSVSTDGIVSNVKEAHQTVDFYVVVIVQSILLALASLATLRWTNQSLIPSVVLSSSIILMPAAYIAAVNNLHEYQNAVQTMINLGRPGLAKKFGLQLPVSNSSEREMWQALSGLVQHRGPQEDYDQVLAPYRIPIPMTDPNE